MDRKLLKGRLERRLTKDASDLLITEDIELDTKLIEEDVKASEAHAFMLFRQGIVSKEELKKIIRALEKIRSLHKIGKFKLDPELEDVHLNIESFVIKEAGMQTGGKLHTGRSRNEQVIVDIRLYLRKEINETSKLVITLVESILNQAEKHLLTIMPGYTHQQPAQPITYAHWLTAHAEALMRDLDRLQNVFIRFNLNPLGACALAGTSWPIDRRITEGLLGFEGIQTNSLDVVSSRGEETAEFLSFASILMIHLSRVAADLILWCTHEFGMIELNDAFTTGSSIMPQKKNPDVAEMIRGKTATIQSKLFLVLSLLKNLPSGYLKDTQETKSALLTSAATLKTVLVATTGMLSTLKVNKKRMLTLARTNNSTATDLADLIARKTSIPFRMSHQIVGTLVRNMTEKRLNITDLKSKDLETVAKVITGKKILITDREIRKAVDPIENINAKKSEGSPNPQEVKRTITDLRRRLAERSKLLAARIKKLENVDRKLQSTITEIIKQ
ncbi:MAG: argininosuccinate lyase [Candidatus Bathyarchaeota archaeon]